MFKTLTVVYSAINFIFLFLVMVLLIIIILPPGAKNSHDSQVFSPKSPSDPKSFIENISPDTSKNAIMFVTDKATYLPDEEIKININNYGGAAFKQDLRSGLYVKCRPQMGKNFEVAFIEKQIDGEWIAIEPLSRCSESCNTLCDSRVELEPKKSKLFTWAQTMLKCNEDGSDSVLKVTAGSYRVSTSVWDNKLQALNKNISNIFSIAESAVN